MRPIKHNWNRWTWSRIEPLERRIFLDGNVTALLQNGDLIIRGDSQDNQILVTQLAAGTVHIAGLENTTINGKGSADISSFSRHLLIRMTQGGEDHIAIEGPVDVSGNLAAQLGTGELIIEGSGGPINIGGDLIVRTAKDGLVTMRNEVRVGGATSIKAGGDVTAVAALATLPDFASAKFDHSLDINNPYFPVVPGTKWVYHTVAVDDETGEVTTQENPVEVTTETRTIAGVQVRVVHDQVFEDNLLTEDTLDFFGQDNNGNVWYFGEDTTTFEYDDNGKVISTSKEGSWTAGVNGGHAGIIMEAQPRIGHRTFQEFSPGVVSDYGEGLATDETATVPAGTFKHAFRTQEATPIEPTSLADKLYAPGVGTIAEFELDIEDEEVIETVKLVSLTLNGNPVTQVVPTTGFSGVNTTGKFIGGEQFNGTARIRSKGAVILDGTKFKDTLKARSKDELVVVNSNLAGNAKLATNDTLSLRQVFADRTIRAVGNPDDVYIFDSDISTFKGRFGIGDNSVFVRHSTFDQLQANGSLGHNTFEDLGNNVFGKRRLRRFAEI